MTQRSLNGVIKMQRNLNGEGILSNVLLAGNNLSDLTNKATARVNLGVSGTLTGGSFTAEGSSYIAITNAFDGTTNEIISVIASTSAIPSTICAYDASGNITAQTINCGPINSSNNITTSGTIICSAGLSINNIQQYSGSSIDFGTANLKDIGTITSGAITSSGNLALGTHSITCGAINASSLGVSGNITGSGSFTLSGAGVISVNATNGQILAPRSSFDLIRPYSTGGDIGIGANIHLTNSGITYNITACGSIACGGITASSIACTGLTASGAISGTSITSNSPFESDLNLNSTGGHSYFLKSTWSGNTTGAGYFLVYDATTSSIVLQIDPTGIISGNGGGLTNLNASNISTGTLSCDGGGLTNLNASNVSTGTLSSSLIPPLAYQAYRTIWAFQSNKNGITSNGSTNLTDMYNVFNMTNSTTNQYTYRFAVLL